MSDEFDSAPGPETGTDIDMFRDAEPKPEQLGLDVA